MVELGRETDIKKRRAIVERVQAIFYEDVGRIKFGDAFTFHVGTWHIGPRSLKGKPLEIVNLQGERSNEEHTEFAEKCYSPQLT